MIDERIWATKADLAKTDLAKTDLEWSSYAYGKDAQGEKARAVFQTRLSQTEAIVQKQDNRAHDLRDSDGHYQF